MTEEDEDDIYAPDEGTTPRLDARSGNGNPAVKNEGGKIDEGEEEGEELEEEEEESDSDIDIITERKGDQKAESLQPPRTNALKVAAPPKTPTADQAPVRRGSPAVKAEASVKERGALSKPGSSYPAVKTSALDVDANPVYEPHGKPIIEIDMDSDFPEDDKPWRRPGTDMTDYFNYGFDEFTWASYCLKQTNMRKEVTDSKKQMEEMQNFLTMPGGIPPMPGMTAAPGGVPPGMPSMGGPSDLPPEMQQMMQQMMAQGVDPMQMDPATVMQMMQQGAGGAGGDSNPNFGGQGYGQQGQNQLHMGYGGGGGGGGGYGGGGGGGRNAGGRGQGRRW